MFRKSLASISLLLILSTIALAQFVGSRHSDKYHRPYCSAARRIKPSNKVFINSAKQAQTSGYIPCKICRPPGAEISIREYRAPAPQPRLKERTYPRGATAICRDGTYSYSQSRRGTYSHHGGVARW